MFTDRKRKEKERKYKIILGTLGLIFFIIYFYWDSSSSISSGIYPLKETGVYFVEKPEDEETFDVKIPILYVRKNPLQFSTPALSNIELYNSDNELISEYLDDYRSVVYSKGILNKESHGEIILTINAKVFLDEESGELVKEEYFRKKYDHILKTIIFDFDSQRYYFKLGESYNIKAFSKNESFYNGPEITELLYHEEKGDNPAYITVTMSHVQNYTIKKSFLWFQEEDERLLENPVKYIKKDKFKFDDYNQLRLMEFPFLSDSDNITFIYEIDERAKTFIQDKVAIINPYYLIEDIYGNREYIGSKSIAISKANMSNTIIEPYRVEKLE